MATAEHSLVELENLLGPRILGAELGVGEPVLFANRFKLEKIRGKGARGLVVKAHDVRLDRSVALKLYPYPEQALIAEAQAEARVLAQLKHPNIVGVFDVDFTEVELGGRRIPCLFLVMEYVDGPHVRAWIASEGPREGMIVSAFLAAGEGLAAAHERGILHRDVKPANIVLDHTTARVVDFGLARSLPRDGDITRTTQYGVTKGTLAYMAPEARRGRAEARSDLFSFAVSLWECLTGVLPFDPEAGEWRLANQPDFFGADALPPTLAAVLRRALSYAPDERQESLRELLDDIQALYQRRRRPSRAPLFLGVGAAAAAAAGLAFAYANGGELATPDRSEALAADVGAAAEQLASPGAPASSPEPDVAPAPRPDPPAAARCDGERFAGRWRLTSRVLWADDSYWIGVEGFYRLDLSVDASCVRSATLTRFGDSGNRRYARQLVAESAMAVARGADGDLWLEGEFRLFGDQSPKRHVFTMTPRGDELVGDWVFFESSDRPTMTGVLRAARGASVGPVALDTASSPCASQCRILCVGERAQGRCVSEICAAGGGLGAEGCGAPDLDAPPPIGAQDLLSAIYSGEAEGEAAGDKCREHARHLDGEWSVWQGGVAHGLELVVSGCELTGQIRARDGSASYPATGVVNSKGQWFLRPSPEVNAPIWALTGRGPAIGLAGSYPRAPLVAYRAG
ncbi:MAG: serine/threonine protein kinase [Myxococcales bacterium]|nr:serine/threonine protein kinase [Myxococcales bacterium]